MDLVLLVAFFVVLPVGIGIVLWQRKRGRERLEELEIQANPGPYLRRLSDDRIASIRARPLPNDIEGNREARLVDDELVIISELSKLAMLDWRGGVDPRPRIAEMTEVYDRMLPTWTDDLRPYAPHAVIAHWAEIYLLFWLAGTPRDVVFVGEADDDMRGHAWDRIVIARVTDEPVPEDLARFRAEYDLKSRSLVDRSFAVLESLLDGAGGEADNLVVDAERYWQQRSASSEWTTRGTGSGFGLEADVMVDVRLGAVLHKIGWKGESAHRWVW